MSSVTVSYELSFDKLPVQLPVQLPVREELIDNHDDYCSLEQGALWAITFKRLHLTG